MQYLTIGIIIIIAILILLCFSRNMAVTRFAVCELIITVVLGATIFFCNKEYINNSIDYTVKQNVKNLALLTELTEGLDEYDFINEEKITKFEERLLDRLSNLGIEENAWGIASADGSNYKMELVKSNSDSFLARNGVTDSLLKIIVKTADSNSVNYCLKDNDTVIYVVTDTTELISNKVLCVEAKLGVAEEAEQLFLEKYLKWVIISWACVSLVIILITYLQGHEWREMVAAVAKTATGRNDISRPTVKNHEMKTMWNALSELTKRMAKENYERYQILQAYFRFAPKRIEDILLKDTIRDVENGSLVNTEGTFALAAAYTKNPILATDEKSEIYNIQYRFALLSEHQNEGVLVSADSELHTLKYLFLNDKAGAIKFAYDSMVALNSVEYMTNENMLFLVHHTNFAYGVTGNEEQAVPFLVSSELDILQKYLEPLSSLGIRVVVTEDMISTLDNVEYRYIGFVGKEYHNFKLYEILDVYPENVRIQRMRTNEKLQQGINLFYKDDFYLARNAFTEVIKDCPSDGLAKWYLFTCEYKLNHHDDKTASYALFPEV